MPPAKKTPAKRTPTSVSDLTPDQIDAVLRDPHVPGNVRSAVVDQHAARQYLGSVEFEDADGYVSVRHNAA